VKREADGKKYIEMPERIMPVKTVRQGKYIVIEEVDVFENEQDKAGNYNAENQVSFALSAFGFLYHYSRIIVYNNGEHQYGDIYRYERHIKIDAGCKQQKPSELMR
jgi:hypothetical protein